MRTMILGLAAVTMTVPALPATAVAQDGRYGRYYDNQGYYNGPVWRGEDGRRHCRRSNGTTGLIVGGAAGALVGRAIDTRGDRMTGTILGAAAGALLGREVQRSRSRCR
ncbi:MAG: glycine zipper 2TM domain-containing protein [Allosphingosinicella sp.]